MIEITEEIVEKVESYVSARLRAEVRREIVDEVSRKILGEKVWRKESTGERITDPRQSYMMSAQDNIEFSGRLRAALSKAGFRLRTLPGRPPHYFLCPAREAERKADRARGDMIAAVIRAAGKDPGKYLPRDCTLEWIEAYDRFAAGIVRAVYSRGRRKLPARGTAFRSAQRNP